MERLKLDAKGFNRFGVQICDCKKYGRPHAYEPGESCSPQRVPPLEEELAATRQRLDRLLAMVLHVRDYENGLELGNLYKLAEEIEKEADDHA